MKILHFANTEWYLFNFRQSLARALRDAGHEVILVSPPGPYGEKLRALGFRWIPAPMRRRSLNPLRELALVRWLRNLIVTERVDLLHGFTIKCAVYGSLAGRAARIRGRVNAVAGMGYVFSSRDVKARLLRPVVRSIMRAALDLGNGGFVLVKTLMTVVGAAFLALHKTWPLGRVCLGIAVGGYLALTAWHMYGLFVVLRPPMT